LWSYIDKNGHEQSDPNRPRITFKHIDSKKTLISFTGRMLPDPSDLIPEGSRDGKPVKGYRFRGHFLDCRTLGAALTDRSLSLKSACQEFLVEHGKEEAEEHGKVTERYIDYNRRDVKATAELAQKLFDEYDLHPIPLIATRAFSAASIGKSYLRTMGITPISARQKSLQPYVGYAQTAYFGGRTSAHIRKVPVPVVHTDFLSMYPTANSLMGLWRFVVAREIMIVDHCQQGVVEFLEHLTVDRLFKPETWKHLNVFVRVVPGGDILPARGRYSVASNDWQVGINHLHAGAPDDSLWFALPDLAASKILTGKMPQIIDAFRIEPEGTLKGLKKVKFWSQIEIHPRRQDFFKA
jgi:hypothetical protein